MLTSLATSRAYAATTLRGTVRRVHAPKVCVARPLPPLLLSYLRRALVELRQPATGRDLIAEAVSGYTRIRESANLCELCLGRSRRLTIQLLLFPRYRAADIAASGAGPELVGGVARQHGARARPRPGARP